MRCKSFVILLAVFLVASDSSARDRLTDAPVVWYDDDRGFVSSKPAEREPNLVWDGVNASIKRPLIRATSPGRAVRRVGSLFGGNHVPTASNVNVLDEVPNSTWFTNRIGLYPMTPEEVARGIGTGQGPDRSGVWTVVSAKTEGVTPGFNIRDAKGNVYLIKFDVPGFLGMTTAAGVISSRIFHAIGYNVPEDGTVIFERSRLVVGESARIKERGGKKRPMTAGDLDMILNNVDRLPDGRWLAISSRFLPGAPIGPFDYKGRRHDDPNDRVKHEHRRELRGLRVFAAWLNHFDTKQHNSLDIFIQEDGVSFVKHYLIDFASTIGAGGRGPTPKNGWEYGFDFAAFIGKTLSLGLYEADWRKFKLMDELPEVGYWESRLFEPEDFESQVPNSAFVNLTDRDGYWATKIVTAFSDEHIRAICAAAGYRDHQAEEYVARVLMERRDKIARRWFDRVTPIDFFRIESDALHWRDLAAERNTFPGVTPRYRARFSAVTDDRKARGWSPWMILDETSFPMETPEAIRMLKSQSEKEYPYIAFEVDLDRGRGWQGSVTAYVARKSTRLIAVDR